MQLGEQKKYYDEIFHKIEDNPINNMKQNAKHKFLKRLLKNSTGEFLVIGCGSRRDMGVIGVNAHGTAIDISKTAIEKSKKIYPHYGYILMDALHMEFKDKSFDTVTLFHVLEHLEKPLEALQEIKRVLKSSGKFLFIEHVADEKGTRVPAIGFFTSIEDYEGLIKEGGYINLVATMEKSNFKNDNGNNEIKKQLDSINIKLERLITVVQSINKIPESIKPEKEKIEPSIIKVKKVSKKK